MNSLVPTVPDRDATIRAVVQEWLVARRMFTAFEVSLACKERGIKERHRDMKTRVHEIIFEEGTAQNYTRMLMDVGAPEQAWLYYGVECDPWTYKPLDRNAHDTRANPTSDSLPVVGGAPLMFPAAAATPLTLGMPNPANVPDGAFGCDRRGRLAIPVNLLRAIQVKPKERVNVVANPETEELSIRKRHESTAPLSADPVEESDTATAYTAEPDGNVRLTQRTLSLAKIAGLQCYAIEDAGDGEIVVKNFNKTK